MAGVRISIVGGGSGQFSLGIVRDLCALEGLSGSSVSFMDVNAERLDAVHAVATRFAAERGADLTFEKTTDRRESLRGADFVINSAMVVGWDKRVVSQEVARRHGYRRGIYLGGLHQFELFMGVIRDMEELCPDAWYVQSANPVFDGCTLITRRSPIKTVGLCHGFHGGVRRVARALGLDPAEVSAEAFGVNHCIWLTKLWHRGQDALPLLDEWVETKAEAYWASPQCDISDHMGPKAVDVYRRLGLYPIGDTATPGGGSYFRWYHADAETERRWQEDPDGWFDRHVSRVSGRVDDVARLAADPAARVTDVFPPTPTGETNVTIIDAIANDRPGVFQVNIPNRGCIPGIADDVVVEIPALVSARGIQGIRTGDLPRRIMCHVQEKILAMERNLEAFESRDPNALLEMVLANPSTRTVEQARAVLDDLLALPFNRAVADYFKWPAGANGHAARTSAARAPA
jgi:alpha-galactosidase